MWIEILLLEWKYRLSEKTKFFGNGKWESVALYMKSPREQGGKSRGVKREKKNVYDVHVIKIWKYNETLAPHEIVIHRYEKKLYTYEIMIFENGSKTDR